MIYKYVYVSMPLKYVEIVPNFMFLKKHLLKYINGNSK